MNKIKEKAEFYRRGLTLGIFSVSEVIKWCDSIILAENSPDIAIIEASISGSRGPDAIVAALSEVSGDFNNESVISRLFGTIYNFLNQDRRHAPGVAYWLYQMALDSNVPDKEVETTMLSFLDPIALAMDETYGDQGDVERITDAMLGFLRKNSFSTGDYTIRES